MADLKQAMIWLSEGKKIYPNSRDYAKDFFIHIYQGEIVGNNGSNATYILHSNDWELFEEKSAPLLKRIDGLSYGNAIEEIAKTIDSMEKRLKEIE